MKGYNFISFSSYSPKSVRAFLGNDWNAIFRHWRKNGAFPKKHGKETPCTEENAMARLAMALAGIAIKLSIGSLLVAIFYIAFFNLI